MVKIKPYAMLLMGMHISSNIFIGVCIYVVVVGGSIIKILIENEALRQEEIAKENWQKALISLNKWLADNPYKKIDSPEGQWLLRTEIGAYELYMYRKTKIDERDKAYICARMILMTDSSYVEKPKT